MDGKNEFREGLFPSGFCITPEGGINTEVNGQAAHLLFNEIDHGQVDERALVLAQQACQSCVQLPFCETQREELATELWQRGAGMTIVGGTSVTVAAAERRSLQERPKLTFDLTRIPSEPETAIAIIRQAFRAGQLNAAGPTPKGVKTASAAYLERLTEADPELRAQLTEIGEDETTGGLKFIFTALFQQKDFESFSRGEERQTRAGNLRYSPDVIDATTDDPIVSHFLKDTIAINKLGFSKAASKAAHFEPEYYAKLAETYKPASMSWSDFDRLIGTNRNPIEAIIRNQARAGAIRSSDPIANHTTVRATVRHGSREALSTSDIAELENKYSGYDFVTPQLIKSILKSNAGNPAGALENVVQRVVKLQECYPDDHPYVRTSDLILFSRTHRSHQKAGEAVDAFAKTMKRLTEKYGDDPDILPSDIRRFSTSYPTGAEQELRDYKTRLEHLRCTSDSRITDTIIRQCARRGITSPIEVAKIYDRRLVHDRFSYRARKEADATALKPELVERIVCLYPRAEINQASEHAYNLINSGLLAFVPAETYSLRGQSREDLDKIFAPKTHEYLAFSESFRSLGTVDRLVFAHHYGLMPLLYGREANALQLEHLALSGANIDDYFDTIVQPRLDELSTPKTQTLSIMELERDLDVFDRLLSQAPHRPLVTDKERLTITGLRDATVVVGGKALYLHEPDYAWDWTLNTPDLREWLEETVSRVYPPHQQDQALNYVAQALDGGVLELLGETPGEYRLVFTPAFYENATSDLERAAIANAMGIDRLLYGSDLSVVLKHRLGDNQVAISLPRHETPEIMEFTDEHLAAARQEVEYEALQLDSRQPLEQFVITALGNVASTDDLTPGQWKRIGNDLLNAYNMHIEHPNHRHEIPDDLTRAEVALAWTHARDGDVRAMARLFSVESEDLESYIAAGTAYIREQFGFIPASRLKLTARLLKQPQPRTRTNEQSNTLGRRRPIVDDTPTEYGSRLEGHTGEQSIIIHKQQDSAGTALSALDTYLRALRNIPPRISYEREVAAFKEIEAGVLAQAKLDESDQDELSVTDKADYLRLVKIGEQAKEEIITNFLPLVVAFAKKYPYRAGLDFSDYIQEGNIGLMHAVEMYDYKPGYKFSTYASIWIKKNMQRAFNTHSRTIRVPDNIADNIQAYHAYSLGFMEKHGRFPTAEEQLEHFGWSPFELESVQIGVQQRPISLQMNLNEKGDLDKRTVGDIIWDINSVSPDDVIDSDETRAAFSTIVRSTLVSSGLIRPALVMTLRHGLDLHPDVIDADFVRQHEIESNKVYDTKEIAAMLGVTESAVTYHHRRAVNILNQPANRKRLQYLLGHIDSPS